MTPTYRWVDGAFEAGVLLPDGRVLWLSNRRWPSSWHAMKQANRFIVTTLTDRRAKAYRRWLLGRKQEISE